MACSVASYVHSFEYCTTHSRYLYYFYAIASETVVGLGTDPATHRSNAEVWTRTRRAIIRYSYRHTAIETVYYPGGITAMFKEGPCLNILLLEFMSKRTRFALSPSRA